MAMWRWFLWLGVGGLLWVGVALGGSVFSGPADAAAPTAQDGYVVLAWNDLGMHCYNRDFTDLAVLPPYNNLHAQVIRVADRPQVVTTGITVTYVFTDNTTSASKSNFWDFEEKLFGVKLQKDIGLKGKSLAGTMDLSGNQFIAEGIPLTEFTDSDPTHPQPFQLATVIVKDVATGKELARTVTVAPVSTEMHCDNCHARGEGASTGKVETNILAAHDEENGTNLMSQRPVLCASCHSSNALGAPGKAGHPQSVQRDAPQARHEWGRRGLARHPGRLLQLPPGSADALPARCDVGQEGDDLYRLPRWDAKGGCEPAAVVE